MKETERKKYKNQIINSKEKQNKERKKENNKNIFLNNINL